MTLKADLDGAGGAETVEVDSRQEKVLTVRHGNELLWRGLPHSWKPWKLLTGRLEAGRPQRLIIGTFKSTRYIRQPHNCLFVFGWNGRELVRLWLGSSLDHPFSDFTVRRIWPGPIDQLVAVETLLDKRQCVAVYSYSSFGFDLDWQSTPWKSIRLLSAVPGAVTIEAEGKRLVLHPHHPQR